MSTTYDGFDDDATGAENVARRLRERRRAARDKKKPTGKASAPKAVSPRRYDSPDEKRLFGLPVKTAFMVGLLLLLLMAIGVHALFFSSSAQQRAQHDVNLEALTKQDDNQLPPEEKGADPTAQTRRTIEAKGQSVAGQGDGSLNRLDRAPAEDLSQLSAADRLRMRMERGFGSAARGGSVNQDDAGTSLAEQTESAQQGEEASALMLLSRRFDRALGQNATPGERAGSRQEALGLGGDEAQTVSEGSLDDMNLADKLYNQRDDVAATVAESGKAASSAVNYLLDSDLSAEQINERTQAASDAFKRRTMGADAAGDPIDPQMVYSDMGGQLALGTSASSGQTAQSGGGAADTGDTAYAGESAEMGSAAVSGSSASKGRNASYSSNAIFGEAAQSGTSTQSVYGNAVGGGGAGGAGSGVGMVSGAGTGNTASYGGSSGSGDNTSYGGSTGTASGTSYSGATGTASGTSYGGVTGTASGTSYGGVTGTASGTSYSGATGTASGTSYSGATGTASGTSYSGVTGTASGTSYSGTTGEVSTATPGDVAGKVDGLEDAGSTTSFDGTAAQGSVAEAVGISSGRRDGTTLQNILWNLADAMEKFPALFYTIAWVMGGYMGIQSLNKFVDYTNNSDQTPLMVPVGLLAGAGLMIASPAFFNMLINSVGLQGQGSGAWFSNIEVDAGDNSMALDVIMARIMDQIQPVLPLLFKAILYPAGILVGITGITRLVKMSEEGPRGPSPAGTFMMFVLCAVLLAAPKAMDAITVSMFNDTTYASYPTFDAGGCLPIQEDSKVSNAMSRSLPAILLFIQIIGWIGFLRGMFIMKQAADGDQQASYFGAFTHIVGGTLAVNFGQLADVIDNAAELNCINMS